MKNKVIEAGFGNLLAMFGISGSSFTTINNMVNSNSIEDYINAGVTASQTAASAWEFIA